MYRYGGEEFAVLLPHTDLAGAHDVAERIVASVAKATLRVGGKALKATCSAGVAQTRRTADAAASDLVERADAVLYAAKAAGRNRAIADASTTQLAPVLRMDSIRRAS
jgi:diguanylate cyclase (GGDEF)-like protein